VALFSTAIFHCRRAGARPGKDALDVTAFPSGLRTIPVEATESVAPPISPPRAPRGFRRGRAIRGGVGQVIELGGRMGRRLRCCASSSGIGNPAPDRVTLVSGKPIGPKGRQSVPGGDFIRLELPGGGGFGDPAARDPQQVALDVADGLISRKAAASIGGRPVGCVRSKRWQIHQMMPTP
jgi:N-methylhydantoinase B